MGSNSFPCWGDSTLAGVAGLASGSCSGAAAVCGWPLALALLPESDRSRMVPSRKQSRLSLYYNSMMNGLGGIGLVNGLVIRTVTVLVEVMPY